MTESSKADASERPQPARLRDVAKAAGVHPSTASRALHPQLSSRLTSEVVERVRQVARDLGYSPNMLAASLRTQRSQTIGVVVPDLTNTMFPPMFRGIEDRVNADGYSAILANSDMRQEKERQIFDMFIDRRVDGLIIATATLASPLVSEARERGKPLVLLNRMTQDLTVSAVVADDNLGVSLAVKHLVDLGHRRIAHIALPQDISTGRTRRDAFVAAIEQIGAESGPSLIAFAQTMTEDEGRRCARFLFEISEPPTAILAGNDTLAIGAMLAAEEAGLTCPRDISITGFNDIPYVDRLRPPLTTIRIPQYAMGYEAGDELMKLLNQPDETPRLRVLKPALVVRGSTAAPRPAD